MAGATVAGAFELEYYTGVPAVQRPGSAREYNKIEF
jgi:hypothetical protein